MTRYYLLSQEDDTFELEQGSPVPADLKLSEKDPLLDSAYPDVAFPSADVNTYLGSKSIFHENPSVDLAPKQLYLKLARPLDWETKQNYAYVIVAEDNGSPALTGQLEVQVVVTDENDNHPTFRNKSFTLSVPENSLKGTRLIQLVAHDPDQGRAGQIVYSLALQPGSGYVKPFPSHSNTAWNSHSNSHNHSAPVQLFTVDSHSGWLILNGPLDYERVKHHLVRVLARDEAGHPGFDEATVNILVTDVNDVPPTISVDPVTDLMPSDNSKSRSPNMDQSQLNVLNLYVNETPRWIGRDGVRHSIAINSVSAAQPMLLAFVAVRDPDTGRGGEFYCGLVQSTNSISDKETAASQSRLYLYGDTIVNADQLFSMRHEELVDRNGPSVVGHFKLNPISATQFELSSFEGFDHEQAAVEEIQVRHIID
ncbi:unnamed protein product [Echinostoma caproni]|uniref:Cadherin domain protein n=1 Tax=Echinostoma caproni TaxID=27848 RepID=A0A183A6K6_9TREM|nr:unnamed protein product [Echinostoma caproni]